MQTIEEVFEAYGAKKSTIKAADDTWRWTHDDLVNFTDSGGWLDAAIRDATIAWKREVEIGYDRFEIKQMSVKFDDTLDAWDAWLAAVAVTSPQPGAKRFTKTPELWSPIGGIK